MYHAVPCLAEFALIHSLQDLTPLTIPQLPQFVINLPITFLSSRGLGGGGGGSIRERGLAAEGSGFCGLPKPFNYQEP